MHRLPSFPVLAALALAAAPLRAQETPPPPPADRVVSDTVVPDTILPAPAAAPSATALEAAGLELVGGPGEERARLRQVLGEEEARGGFLLRSPSSRLPAPAGGVRVRPVLPRAALVWNSDLPFSLNDGAMWAGRGRTAAVLAGVRVDAGPVRLVLAPQVWRTENEPFQVFPGRDSTRSPFSSPWYAGSRSADLPLRFGQEPVTQWDLGQSSLTVFAGPVAAGAATENQWWGPGIRNAIVLSNHAAGVPHLFLRTARPLRTPLGEVEARWIAGRLTQSVYFDTVPDADREGRALSGFAATLRPGGGGLAVGVARVVYASGGVAEHAFDAFFRGGPDRPAGDSVASEGPEQITSLFARWVFPGDRAEVYAEWARSELPGSLGDFVSAPHHSQGYTLGLQWARPVSGGAIRLQGEASYLEQSATSRYRRVPTFYASASVPQGYTQRGQVLGAAIGPGSSSQWAAGDYVGARWSAGLFLGRIRWEDDAHNLLAPPSFPFLLRKRAYSHDVSVLGGLRGGVRLAGYEVGAEVTLQRRYNYLFQNPDLGGWNEPPPGTQVDIDNTTLRLTVSPLR